MRVCIAEVLGAVALITGFCAKCMQKYKKSRGKGKGE